MKEQESESHIQLCDPMDCSARLLCPWDFPGKNPGVVTAISFPRRSSQPRYQTHVPCVSRQIFFLPLSHQERLKFLEGSILKVLTIPKHTYEYVRC